MDEDKIYLVILITVVPAVSLCEPLRHERNTAAMHGFHGTPLSTYSTYNACIVDKQEETLSKQQRKRLICHLRKALVNVTTQSLPSRTGFC